MGFALWVRDGVAWAAGTHEYRPMGVAIVAATAQFSLRDFHVRRKLPATSRVDFQGFFGSMEEMNVHLRRARTRPRSHAMSRGIELRF